jgi:hypothetical protein
MPNLNGHIELANTENDFSIQFCQYLADFFGPFSLGLITPADIST